LYRPASLDASEAALDALEAALDALEAVSDVNLFSFAISSGFFSSSSFTPLPILFALLSNVP
jgi:hypothetical protein